MLKVNFPTSDANRIVLLQTALATADGDATAGRARLPQSTLDEVTALHAAFEAGQRQVVQAKAARTQAVADARAAMQALEAQVRQVWSTVHWRVRWDGVSPAVLAYYQLNQERRRPYPNSRAAWLDLAEQIVAGDAEAVAAGFATATDDEALPAALAAAQAAVEALAAAKQTLRLSQKEVRTVRQQADALIRRLLGDLRYALRDETPSLQREVMRTYGVRFQSTAPTPAEEPMAEDDPMPAARSLAAPVQERTGQDANGQSVHEYTNGYGHRNGMVAAAEAPA